MKLRATSVLLSSLLSSLLSLAVWAQAPVLEISGANFKPLPLALPQVQVGTDGAKARAQEFDEALLFDLTAAGIFQVLDRKSFTADPKEGLTAGTLNFSRWADVGAEALVKTQVTLEGDQLHGELRLFSVSGSREDLKLGKSVPQADARKLAHYFADALFRQFTREPGPFQSHLAFVRKTAAGKDVYVSDWDGKNARAVATGTINLLPALGPDGTVAFTSYRRGRPELFSAKGGVVTPVVPGSQMATGVSYAPEGRRIAYSLAQGDGAQIWVSSADGSGAKAITSTPFFINSSPSWSPDGKRIAFVSNRGGSPQIYVMGSDGSGIKRLTFQGNYNQTPDWSPRGDLIAFTARDERNAFDLFTVNVDTGKIARLTQDTANNEEPSFSPNGRLIVFNSTRNKGGARLYVMTWDGQNQLALPMDRGDFTTPDWAP